MRLVPGFCSAAHRHGTAPWEGGTAGGQGEGTGPAVSRVARPPLARHAIEVGYEVMRIAGPVTFGDLTGVRRGAWPALGHGSEFAGLHTHAGRVEPGRGMTEPSMDTVDWVGRPGSEQEGGDRTARAARADGGQKRG